LDELFFGSPALRLLCTKSLNIKLMKTILHNTKRLTGKACFLAAMLLIMCFSIQSKAQNCGAGFSYGAQGYSVYFMDSSFVMAGDSVVNWSWTFGDGAIGSGASTWHQYAANGVYNVCLTITTAQGCSNTSCYNVVVNANPCNLTASIFPDSSGTGLYVAVNGGTAPYAYIWSNGATTAALTGLSPGLYCVTVTDANNCTANSCDSAGVTYCNPYFIFSMQGNVVTFQNYSSGNYTSLLWDFGDSTTSNALNPVHTYANAGVHIVCLTLVDSNGNACNQYCQAVTTTAPYNSTLCGSIFVDYNGNGIFDSTDTYLSGQYVVIYGNSIQMSVYTDSLGNYTANVPAGTYTISYCPGISGAIVSLPLDSSLYCGVYYNVTVTANQTACGYNFAIQYTSVQVEGTVFVDLNVNGIMDAGEPGIPYQQVALGVYSAYTNSNGQYSIFVPAGTYSIQYTPQGAYSGFSLTTPGSISVNAATVGNTYSGNNFGVNVPPGITDLSVQLVPHTTVTPGFPAWYDIYVCNYGVTPVAANVTMIYDAALNYNYASPAESSHNAVTHTLTWTTGIILPGNCQTIWVTFGADSTLTLGAPTLEYVSVTPASGSDNNLSNNTDTIHQIINGSWDPNNKLSVKTNNNDPNMQFISAVNPDQEIIYTVNFQNTGTGTAVNVVVIDQLSSDLDASSFQLMGTSHTCNVSRTGSQVVYTFSNIMLADSGSNQVGSHGFVTFKANSLNSLAPGTLISDNASIYFDFNQPVITGNTHIVMFNPLGVDEVNGSLKNISVYPNPVKGSAAIDFSLSSTSEVSLEIMDLSGRVCQKLLDQTESAGQHSITWNTNLQAGIYFVKLEVNGAVSLTKVSVIR
jgi:uncharacterized repeat protein (TIGR01451 family)